MSSLEPYLSALRDTRDAALADALQMAEGQAPLDATILLSTLEAVAALAARGESTPDGQALLELAPRSAPLAAAVDQLDLTPAAVDLDAGDPADQGDRLHGLAALAIIAPLLPMYAQRKVREVVERNAALAAVEPERVTALAPLGAFLAEALPFPEPHPASQLFAAVSCAAEVADTPWPAQAVWRGVERARRELSGAPQPWVAWLKAASKAARDVAASAATWLDVQLAEPIPVKADTGRVRTPRERFRLAEGPGWELNLVLVGGEPLLEWVGDTADAPVEATLQPEGRPFDAAPAIVEGSVCWHLGPAPTTAEAVVVMRGPRGVIHVDLRPEATP